MQLLSTTFTTVAVLVTWSAVAVFPSRAQDIVELEPERQFPRPGHFAAADLDHDGIADATEQALAEQYAPIVFHLSEEPNLPCSVDWMLQRTALMFHDNFCGIHARIYPSQGVGLTQEKLHWSIRGSCSLNDRFDSFGCADFGNLSPPFGFLGSDFSSIFSRSKERTFYLTDVEDEYKPGSPDTRDWVTYFHAYPNRIGGVTIQYWRCYAFNTGTNFAFFHFNHGGDWEGCQVILDSSHALARVIIMNDKDHLKDATADVDIDNGHPQVYVSKGDHGTFAQPWDADPVTDVDDYGYRHESWTGGNVTRPDGHVSTGGALVNVGEKLACLNKQYFIAYSGLWGRPGHFTFTGGYWGPAFNDTNLGKDGFITAWAHDMRTRSEEECYPCHIRWELAPDGELWQIDKPNVRRPRTPYSLVRFLPGDLITFTAGGCVQTGGSGDTWKSYLHPDSDDLYFAEIDLPGVTNCSERLAQYVDRPMEVAGEFPVHLTLGYRDDDYGDNGYWGHDDGTEDQCAGVGDAFVSVRVVRPAAAPTAMTGDAAEIWTAVRSSDGRTLFTGGGHSGAFGEIKVWDIVERRLVETYPRSASLVRSLALSDDGVTLASGEADGTLRLWDTRRSELTWSTTAHVKPVSGLTFQRAAAQMVVSASEDCEIKAWPLSAAGNPLWIRRGVGPQFSLQTLPDGLRLFSGGRGVLIDSADLALRQLNTGNLQIPLAGHKLPVMCAVISTNGNLLITADGSLKSLSAPATARVWDLASTNERFVLNGHNGPIFSLAATDYHGHQILATASADSSVRLWDLATGEEVAVVHTDAVAAAVAFDTMSRLLIVADSTRQASKPSGRVLVWELRRLIARLLD